MSTYKYERYLSRVARQPWAILPEKFAELIELAQFRAAGQRLSDEELQARFGAEATSRGAAPRDGSIAVIPILGTIAYRADSFEASSGGASAQRIRRQVEMALADERVSAILLDIDSPGGSIEGIADVVESIAAARQAKPVWAIANAMAASAAYWIASQADKLFMLSSGRVGAIGVFVLAPDVSEHLAKEGIKINAISAGDNKLEGVPFLPLTDEARAHLQAQVDTVYADFVRAVAHGRRVSQATVKEQFGQGRMYMGKEALKLGMVDGIATFEDVAAQLLAKVKRSARSAQAGGVDLAIAADALKAPADWTSVAVADTEDAADDLTVQVVLDVDKLVAAVLPDATTPEPTVADTAAQEADQDYMDAAIRIAERT